MPIDFPNSPTNGDTYSEGTKTWQYNGTAWDLVLGSVSIPSGSVDSAQLASGAVTTAKILAGAVTTAKIAADSVTTAKIAANAVTQANLASTLSGVTICTSSTKPGSPFAGQIIYMTDTDETAVWEGTYWEGLNRAGGRNVVINGAMNVWQRGTSFTITAGVLQYTADRWQQYFNGNGIIAQETTVKPDTSLFSLRMTATATSVDNAIFQLVEHRNMAQFKGKTVTLSVKLAGTATTNPFIDLAYSTTADDSIFDTGTAAPVISATSPAINASTFVTYTRTFTVPTTAKTLRIGIGTGAVVNTNVLYVTGVQLEAGSVATPFEFEDFGTTLAKCFRYFYRHAPTDGISYLSYVYAGSQFRLTLPLPVQMRQNPSSVTASGWAGGTTPSVNGLNKDAINFYSAAGNYYISPNGTVIDVSAEL